ncbi:TRAP transporter small permease [Leucobacter sp. G161]|uniref:TRAP transporter small permease n=1 Tax=Leucobacter sp. G161 TaxID=663704 RepID=UPI00073B5B15|nr:TRAP transporter small permease subunit [Leucobacter sp. G161]KUF08560.1 hypothetical protein AUL38_00145 [Leucobacter sp. G161]
MAWLARGTAVIAGACFVYMLVATALGVYYRKVLSQPSAFLFGSSEVAMGLTVFLSLAFVMLHNGHVRMEVLPAAARRGKILAGRLSTLISAFVLGAFAVVVFRQFLNDVDLGIRIGSNSGPPRWIPMLALAIGLTTFALTLLRRQTVLDADDSSEELSE